MASLPSKTSSSTDYPSPDCSSFLNWDEEKLGSEAEKTEIFQSLIATVKYQPDLDVSLEAKAVKFLESLDPKTRLSANSFLIGLGTTTANSSRIFVESITVLLSSTSRVIATAAMEMLQNLIFRCSMKVHFALIKDDLFPQLMTTLNLQSLSFTDAVDIHNCLTYIIFNSVNLSTPNVLDLLRIEGGVEQQAVCKTVLTQVVAPSEKYIWHLCVKRFSIIERVLSLNFLRLLAQLLEICPYYQPTMEFVLHTPVFLSIPSYLTFFENDEAIWTFLILMKNIQLEWNKQGGAVRQMWKTMRRMLRMEGFEDVMEEKLQNDRNGDFGRYLVNGSIRWNNLLGMNLQEQE
ncbi:hypothetical protein BLNAU_11977 [Blattamonas nauphoetae]|uniref:Uncharacterized protein n=1 Tax=Blattamonas nauphoetae TaxID=2049346 RepID=A0ABQ9XKN0_9EUKA|nr:hypothetical protein BLNAU_11977 [Blattamonas nauphoetae]